MNKRFFAFTGVQACGAFNDNLYRQALVILMSFQLASTLGEHTGSLIALSSALFVMPFFLFSALGGQLADSWEKIHLIRWLKCSELVVMLLAFVGFYTMQLWVLCVALFLMGTQSALFGPVKYAIIPQLVGKSLLVAANSVVEASTFIAILLGTILSGLILQSPHGERWLAAACVGVALAGIGFSRAMPMSKKAREHINTMDWQLFRGTRRLVLNAWAQPDFRFPMVGIAWFWGLGTVCVAQIAFFAKTVLLDDGAQVPWLLASFTIGIALGAALCAIMLRRELSDKPVWPAAWGFAVLACLLYVLIDAHSPLWLVMMLLMLMAACAGMIAVPLYSVLQHRADTAIRGQIIAASNIINAAVMVSCSLGAAIWLVVGDVLSLFLILGVLTPIILLSKRWMSA